MYGVNYDNRCSAILIMMLQQSESETLKSFSLLMNKYV